MKTVDLKSTPFHQKRCTLCYFSICYWRTDLFLVVFFPAKFRIIIKFIIIIFIWKIAVGNSGEKSSGSIGINSFRYTSFIFQFFTLVSCNDFIQNGLRINQ